MKIKQDFVTNSSSMGFIVGIPSNSCDWFNEYIETLNQNPDAQDEGVSAFGPFRTIEELQTYVHGSPFDWISKATGLQYNYMSKETYLKSKEAIETGSIIFEVSVDYNVCEEFDSECRGYILEERY